MLAQARPATRIPFQVADSFVLALDDFMARTEQGGHVSQSVLELAGPPNFEKLHLALRRLLAKHPLLLACPRRSWRTLLPYWSVPSALPESGLPVQTWFEEGAANPPGGATGISCARECLQAVMMVPLPTVDGHSVNARLDMVVRRDGRWVAALSWSHLLLDGKGAELLLEEIGRLCAGLDLPPEPGACAAPTIGVLEKLRQAQPAMNHLTGLQKTGTPSLGGPRPRRGRGFYEVLTLGPEQFGTVKARMEEAGCALFPFTFYVACVARAHDRVFRTRGKQPAGYGISVPTQTRRRGARGPLFHNHVAVLYFHPRREHLDSLAATTAAMKAQFAAMTRAKISESFNAVLDLMRRVPTRLFLWIIRAQFRGEICSCFHSYTGQFAPELREFADAWVQNAYHLPCLGTPPGTGIFFGERDDLLNVTISWREGALTGAEQRLMVDQLRADLLGEPTP